RSTSFTPVLRSERFVGNAALPVRRNATMAFSSSSFSQLLRSWDTDALSEVLQLVEIPVAVLEVAQRHHRRQGLGHAATAYLFQRRPFQAASVYQHARGRPAWVLTHCGSTS